jgi:hypothetical protein
MGALDLAYENEPGGDLSAFNITQDLAHTPAFLLVKDGAHLPSWYLFNLTLLGWNGTDTIELSGFWPGPGAISHVSLYRGETTNTPDGGSMVVLLGGAVAVLGFLRRKISA